MFVSMSRVKLSLCCVCDQTPLQLACSRLRDSGERNQCEADVEKIARELGRERGGGQLSPQFSLNFFHVRFALISFPTISEPGTGYTPVRIQLNYIWDQLVHLCPRVFCKQLSSDFIWFFCWYFSWFDSLKLLGITWLSILQRVTRVCSFPCRIHFCFDPVPKTDRPELIAMVLMFRTQFILIWQ